MKLFRPYLYCILELLIFLLSFILDEAYIELSIALTIVVLFSVLDKLGKGIVLRELMSLHGCIVCVIMPIVGYQWYTISNPLSKLWVTYMHVPAETYFAYILPAMAIFAATISWPSNKQNVSDQGPFLDWYIKRAKPVLEKNNKVAYQIIIVGTICSLIAKFLPSALQFVASLLYWGSFSGFLYVYFNHSMPRRKLILWGFTLYIIANALALGMFTIIAYMGLTIFSFLFLGKKTSTFKKLSFFLLGVFALLLIQSVKKEYRTQIWSGYEGNNAALFSSLLADQLTNGKSFFTVEAFFKMYTRANEGYNIALVMKHIPAKKEYDNGENLFNNVAAAIVPRIFWPDKPKSGGKANMEYYAGWKIEGWSTDVSPLGEAYGSFGPTGAIVFMWVLALFIRFAYLRFFWISRKIPLLLFWLPTLFFQITCSMETSTLEIMNTLLKGSFFLWILFKLKPDWFGRPKQKVQFRKPIPQLR